MVLVTLAGFVALLLKLANLQAVSPDRYRQQARDQRRSTEPLPATRGAIVDRNGEPLVTTVTRKTIYTDPANIAPGQGPAVAKALAPLLDTDEATLLGLLEGSTNFQYLARKVSDDTAKAVMALGFAGIYSLDEATRLKPAEGLALSVLGRVDTENMGISGVELAYDKLLTGTPGELVQERSLGGDHTIPSANQRVEPATAGSTVMLSLDRNLQQVTERAVADQVTALGAKAGTAVVMDRATGEVLSLASVMADKTGAAGNDEQNRAITTTYDPGSVMKIVTMAGVIETGLVSATTLRRVPPLVEIAGETFRDDSRFHDEDMTVTDILARSSNVGTMLLAQDLGGDRLAEGIASFGFGTGTGIGLEHEEVGQVLPRAQWSDTSLPTMAIGQGVNVTPLQMLAAYNTVANDGEYVSPTMVRSIMSPGSDTANRQFGSRHRVVSQDTAAQLRSMLATVVSAGTGSQAAVEGYRVAGKTGTAWKWRNEVEQYGRDGDRDYLATFVGFAPAEDPRFSIIVVIDEPRSGNYTGGGAAAPVFATIAGQALLSYDVPPDAPGWTQPADGTNLRARAAQPPPAPVVTAPGAASPARAGTAPVSAVSVSPPGSGSPAPVAGVAAPAAATAVQLPPSTPTPGPETPLTRPLAGTGSAPQATTPATRTPEPRPPDPSPASSTPLPATVAPDRAGPATPTTTVPAPPAAPGTTTLQTQAGPGQTLAEPSPAFRRGRPAGDALAGIR